MHDETAQLLEQLQRSMSDEGTWGVLLEMHRERLRRMITIQMNTKMRGRVDPSDVIQEAFVDASNRLPEYLAKPEVPFYVWLRSLTSQRLAMAHRQHLGTKARDAYREVSIDHAKLPTATSMAIAAQLIGQFTTPSEVAMAAEQRLALTDALETLEPDDREILAFRHFEELSNAEVAAILNIKPTAASNRYVRALTRLRTILTRQTKNPSDLTP